MINIKTIDKNRNLYEYNKPTKRSYEELLFTNNIFFAPYNKSRERAKKIASKKFLKIKIAIIINKKDK